MVATSRHIISRDVCYRYEVITGIESFERLVHQMCCSAHKTYFYQTTGTTSTSQFFPFLGYFRHSALAPDFSIDPISRKGDIGFLVHSRESGEATAVSVTSFHQDLVAEI